MADTTNTLGSINPQTQSPFFNKLPAEIRLCIYEYVFRTNIHLSSSYRQLGLFDKGILSALYTCKLFWLEAKGTPFEVNWFCWCILDDGLPPQSGWKAALLKIRNLRLEIECLSTYRSLAIGKGPTDDYVREVGDFFDLFDRGSHLRRLDLKIFEAGYNVDVVDKALSELRGLAVNATITVSLWGVRGWISPPPERKESIFKAIRES